MYNIKQIVVVGLGYVGLPLALAFSKKYKTFGYDVNTKKISDYKQGIDSTGCGNNLSNTNVYFTDNEEIISECDMIIVAVPTPVDEHNKPELNNVIEASSCIGVKMKRGAIVVYESTGYPGMTEEICIPILEKNSGYKINEDFFVGYSPERINPGDSIHTLETITKLVSGSNELATDCIYKIYMNCLGNRIKKVSSIKVAESAKLMENIQRDVNIALANEMAKILHVLGINSQEVFDAASTKWNFFQVHPGLVGGHCIGVDPYYLIDKASKMNVSSELISTARDINNSMGIYIAKKIVNLLKLYSVPLNSAKVLIKGVTYKENVNDIRNTKVVDIAFYLKKQNIAVFLEDNHADEEAFQKTYDLSLAQDVQKVDVVVFAVAHDEYRQLSICDIKKLFRGNVRIIIDVYGILDTLKLSEKGFVVWTL